MKSLALFLFVIILALFSKGQSPKTEFAIIPIDESTKDASLINFIDSLRICVISKDTIMLCSMLDDDIVTSYGGGVYGKKGFVENWNLDRPDSSKVWELLLRVTNLGGVFDLCETDLFSMPYANANRFLTPIMQSHKGFYFDPYFDLTCLRANVPVYEKPDVNSKTIGVLDYNIVSLVFDTLSQQYIYSQDDNWVYISAYDLDIIGWAEMKNFYYLGGLTLQLKKIKGKWRIIGFFPFD